MRLISNIWLESKIFGKKIKEDLRKTQRLWIQYRDAKCGMFYHSESGSGGLEDLNDCMIKETIQRTKELNEGW
ncbi:lysozyme inhibitor LprI family protein [Photobacterium leiognathi]|uniref:lysozyme inhibitor LprI family protein n=1 Tax=Photobacterium leiognathi TaxID=553611 RepID=UPI0029815011|nr:lysozyme inhibitor LprI family protein [Photobacterium leiognathi]